MATEAQKRASRKYVQSNVRQVALHLNCKTDADIIEYLDRQPSKMATIKEALRSKMQAEKKGE